MLEEIDFKTFNWLYNSSKNIPINSVILERGTMNLVAFVLVDGSKARYYRLKKEIKNETASFPEG